MSDPTPTEVTAPAPMPSLRLPDWAERLNALLVQRLRAPYKPGTNDCCLFAADALQALWGVDVASHLRGHYSTEEEGRAVLALEGGVQALAEAVLGMAMENPAMAQRGDIVLADVEGQQMLGVVVGGGQWCAPGPRGLVYRLLDDSVLDVWKS